MLPVLQVSRGSVPRAVQVLAVFHPLVVFLLLRVLAVPKYPHYAEHTTLSILRPSEHSVDNLCTVFAGNTYRWRPRVGVGQITFAGSNWSTSSVLTVLGNIECEYSQYLEVLCAACEYLYPECLVLRCGGCILAFTLGIMYSSSSHYV